MESEQEAPISAKAQEQLQKLVRVCKTYSDAASLFPDHFISESGNLSPPLRRAAAQTVPMLQFYQEKRHLLAASPHPDRLIEKIEYLKDSGYYFLLLGFSSCMSTFVQLVRGPYVNFATIFSIFIIQSSCEACQSLSYRHPKITQLGINT
ncbi:hypothetical protein O6H91_Y081200 [Diphasiastrum complanatum]|nr:hypothetical protein O6H91_Y081200 [Diphasiastrum complanatum]